MGSVAIPGYLSTPSVDPSGSFEIGSVVVNYVNAAPIYLDLRDELVQGR